MNNLLIERKDTVLRGRQFENQTTSETEFFKIWKDPPVPVYFKVWVFTVDNWQEVQNGERYIRTTEKGPYVFREFRVKDIHEMDNNEITYQWRNRFEFLPEMSGVHSLQEKITTFNIPVMSLMAATKKMNEISYNSASAAGSEG